MGFHNMYVISISSSLSSNRTVYLRIMKASHKSSLILPVISTLGCIQEAPPVTSAEDRILRYFVAGCFRDISVAIAVSLLRLCSNVQAKRADHAQEDW